MNRQTTDIQHQLELMRLVSQLPLTVVVALHDLNLAANYCQRLILLKAGQIAATGAPEAVLTPANIEDTVRKSSGLQGRRRDHDKLQHGGMTEDWRKSKTLRYCYRRGFEFGGSVEIRTLEPFRVAGFQDRCLQPLGHAS